MVFGFVYWYIVFGGCGSIFDIEQFTYVHINTKVKMNGRSLYRTGGKGTDRTSNTKRQVRQTRN